MTDADADASGDDRRTYDAVVDRFEGGLAVLVVEKERTTELVLDHEALPPDGRHVDARLRVSYEAEEVVDVELGDRESVSRDGDGPPLSPDADDGQ